MILIVCIYVLESSGRPSGGLDSSGWHSDQGSQNQGIAWGIRLRKMIRSNTGRLFVENSDARLTGIVIWTDDPYFEFFTRGPWNRSEITKSTKYMFQKSRGVFLGDTGSFVWLYMRIYGLNYAFWMSGLVFRCLDLYFGCLDFSFVSVWTCVGVSGLDF